MIHCLQIFFHGMVHPNFENLSIRTEVYRKFSFLLDHNRSSLIITCPSIVCLIYMTFVGSMNLLWRASKNSLMKFSLPLFYSVTYKGNLFIWWFSFQFVIISFIINNLFSSWSAFITSFINNFETIFTLFHSGCYNNPLENGFFQLKWKPWSTVNPFCQDVFCWIGFLSPFSLNSLESW